MDAFVVPSALPSDISVTSTSKIPARDFFELPRTHLLGSAAPDTSQTMKELLLRALALFHRQVPYVWDGTCATGIHMIVARGSTEAPGLGRIGVVAQNVSMWIANSSIAAVDYPATFENYFTSYATGASEFERLVLEHVEACPDTKIALLGYSQGAHAMMDAVCGNGDDDFVLSSNFTKALGSQVVAVVGFGDPSFNATAPWSDGTSSSAGLFARKNITTCEPYASKIRSWCDEGDVYCDLGDIRAVHGSYFQKYLKDATQFVVEKYYSSEPVIDLPATTTAPPNTTPTSATVTSTGTPTETTTETPTETTTETPTGTLGSGAGSFGPAWIMVASIAGSMMVWTELL